MSALKRKVRRLEHFRKTHKGPKVAETQGRGNAVAREAKKIALQAAVSLRKKSGKLVKELEALSVGELTSKLAAARQELFNLRFKQATAQLTDVAAIPATKRQIARILTLIKQKEMGA